MLTQAQYNAITDDIAASIEPSLVAAIDDRRDEILADVGFLARWIAVRMWSAILTMVPLLARIALAEILTRFAGVTIGELTDLITTHRAAKLAQQQEEATWQSPGKS